MATKTEKSANDPVEAFKTLQKNRTRLAEYEVFVQYYSKLIELLQDHEYKLYRHIFEYKRYQLRSHSWIITYFDMFSTRGGIEVGGVELLLAIQAMELHSGRTSLLYEILKFMESSKEDDHQQLATEIQLNIKRFDPNNLPGLQLSGFDILMQYYNKLRDQMSTHSDICYLFNNSGIITLDDWRFINWKDKYAAELILTRLANCLLCGKTDLFHKMLEILQSESDVSSHDLVAEIQLALSQSGIGLAEYEVFVQYYSKLIELLRDQAYQLYRHTVRYHSTSHSWITRCFEMFSRRDNSKVELLLAIQAMELHSGRTLLLYEMLKFMESSKEDDHQQLATEIKLNIKRFHPIISSGLQLSGFDILMQYYNKLRDQMTTYPDLCFLFEDFGIITLEDMRFIKSSLSYKEKLIISELTLTRLANHLLCGKTNMFYEMLMILQSRRRVIHHDLVDEIQLVLEQNIPIVTGTHPREYEVFIQLYSTMAKTLWGYTDELSMGFCKDQTITSSENEEIMSSPRDCRTQLLLNKLALKLRNGNVDLFDKIVKMMQKYKKYADIQQMATQMQKTFEELDAKKSIAMSKEKQPVVQDRQQKAPSLDLEYKSFMQYHSRLSDVPSLLDLTSYFVTANIITKSDGDVIINTVATESQTAALRRLLNKISLSLLRGHGGNKSFDKMLMIMQIYGSGTVQLLANEMLQTIVRLQSPHQITSPNAIRKNINFLNQAYMHVPDQNATRVQIIS